jgi:hypothetical protein
MHSEFIASTCCSLLLGAHHREAQKMAISDAIKLNINICITAIHWPKPIRELLLGQPSRKHGSTTPDAGRIHK